MVDETLCQPEDVSSSYNLYFHSHWPSAEVFQSITQFVKPVCQDMGQLWNKSIHMKLQSSKQKATHSKNSNKVQSRARCCAEVMIKCLMSHFTKSIIMIIIIKWYKSWKGAVYMLSFVVFEWLTLIQNWTWLKHLNLQFYIFQHILIMFFFLY